MRYWVLSFVFTLQWRQNERDGVSNHQPHDCLLNRLLVQIKENIKAPRRWPLCGEFTVTGEFPAQRASNAEKVSFWWRHQEFNWKFSSVPVVQPHDNSITLKYLRVVLLDDWPTKLLNKQTCCWRYTMALSYDITVMHCSLLIHVWITDQSSLIEMACHLFSVMLLFKSILT